MTSAQEQNKPKLSPDEIRQRLSEGLRNLYRGDSSNDPGKILYVQSHNLDQNASQSKVKQILDLKRVFYSNIFSQQSLTSFKKTAQQIVSDDQFEAQIKLSEEEITRLRIENESLLVQLHGFRAQADFQQKGFSEMQATYENKIADLRNELSVLASRNSKNEAEAQRLKRQCDIQAEELAAVEGHNKQRILALTEKLGSSQWSKGAKEMEARVAQLERELIAKSSELQQKDSEAAHRLFEEKEQLAKHKELVRRLQMRISELELNAKQSEQTRKTQEERQSENSSTAVKKLEEKVQALQFLNTTLQAENYNFHFAKEKAEKNARQNQGSSFLAGSNIQNLQQTDQEVIRLTRMTEEQSRRIDHYKQQLADHAETYNKIIAENEKLVEKLAIVSQKKKQLKLYSSESASQIDIHVKSLIAYKNLTAQMLNALDENLSEIPEFEQTRANLFEPESESANYFQNQLDRFRAGLNELANFYKEELQKLKTTNQELTAFINSSHNIDYNPKDPDEVRRIIDPKASLPEFDYQLTIEKDLKDDSKPKENQKAVRPGSLPESEELANEIAEQPVEINQDFEDDGENENEVIVYEEIPLDSQKDRNAREMQEEFLEGENEDNEFLRRELRHKVQQVQDLKEINETLKDRLAELNRNFFEEKERNFELYKELSASDFRVAILQKNMEDIWSSLDAEFDDALIRQKLTVLQSTMFHFLEYIEHKLKSFEELKEEHKKLIEEKASVKHIESLQTGLEGQRKHSQSLEEKLQTTLNESAKLTSSVKTAQEERDSALHHLRKERERLEEFQKEVEIYKLRAEELQAEGEENEKRMKLKFKEKSEQKRKKSIDEISALEREIEELTTALQTVKNERESQLKTLTEEIKELKHKIFSAETQLEESKTNEQLRKKQEKSHQDSLKDLQASNDQLKNDLAKKQTQIDSLIKEKSQLSSQVSALEQQVGKLKTVSEKEHKEVLKEHQTAESLLAQNNDLSEKLKEALQRLKLTESEKTEQVEEVKKTELGYKHLEEKYQKLQQMYKEAKEGNSLLNENKELKQEIKNLEALKTANEDLKAQIQKLKLQIGQSKQKITQLEAEKSAIAKTKDSQVQENIELKKQLDSKKKEVSQLAFRENDLSQRLIATSQVKESLEDQLKQSDVAIKDQRKMIRKYKQTIEKNEKSIKNFMQSSQQQYQSETFSIDIQDSDSRANYHTLNSPKPQSRNHEFETQEFLTRSLPAHVLTSEARDSEIQIIDKEQKQEEKPLLSDRKEAEEHSSIYSQPKKRKNKKKKKQAKKEE